MATASTKSPHRKKGERKASSARPASSQRSASGTALAAGVSVIPERAWWIASAAVLLVAACLRFYLLELKPLHHDEGVNGFFLLRLLREGLYRYDPRNYHGPTLYYFAALPSALFGLSTFVVRAVPALCGVATVWLALCLRRHIGAVGALTAAALIAVSPGAVYLSRYFIHESLFVCFTLALVVAGLRFYERGETQYLLWAAAAAALLFATKETAFISAGTLILAALVTWGYFHLRERAGRGVDDAAPAFAPQPDGPQRARYFAARLSADSLLERVGGAQRLALLAGAALAVFCVVYYLFYSSFFTNPNGLRDSLRTFEVWRQTGHRDHTKPFWTYFEWLQREEAAIYMLGTLGAVWATLGARNRFALFAGAWAFGLLVAYSLIPYKTPWLALSFIVPLALSGGYAADWLYRGGTGRPAAIPEAESGADRVSFGWRRGLLIALIGAAIIASGRQAMTLNFRDYDNEERVYVYAHTQREFLHMIGEIEELARRAGTGEQTAIAIASPDYWPLPWYLREYKRVGYHNQLAAANDAVIVVGKQEHEAHLRATLGEGFRLVGAYPLRPGVTLLLYARRGLGAAAP